ncbi:MAG: hypothetical protein DRP09_08760 [Candidatus Thorarchaeota archaeon]|nr:MAG: hypothetical protein DRP09_08760 [Candidatus Thorarchaeota archaeon]
MSEDGDNHRVNPRYVEDDPDYDWREYGLHESQVQSLEAKDYVALFIAALQTVFLPLLILTLAMVGIGFFWAIIF